MPMIDESPVLRSASSKTSNSSSARLRNLSSSLVLTADESNYVSSQRSDRGGRDEYTSLA